MVRSSARRASGSGRDQAAQASARSERAQRLTAVRPVSESEPKASDGHARCEGAGRSAERERSRRPRRGWCRAHFLRERLVGEHEPVTEGVLRERVQVLGEHVVAATHEGEGARCLDEADRPARARTEGDVLLQVGHAVAQPGPASRSERDRVADERRVDVDVEDGASAARAGRRGRAVSPQLGRRDELRVARS